MSPVTEIEVLVSPSEATEAQLRDRQVVVIDVLRATTVIACALANGAEQVIPAASVEGALDLKAQFEPGAALLCGERDGKRVAGFDLGNSPLEYTRAVVLGRSLVLASTNGTVILSRCGAAACTFAAAFVNLSAVARAMKYTGGSWLIAVSGKLGRACLEDLVCAGQLARAVLGPVEVLSGESGGATRAAGESPADPHDGLTLAQALDDALGHDLPDLFRICAHGRYLSSIGFSADLSVCGDLDSLNIVPELRAGRIYRADVSPQQPPKNLEH